MDEVDLELAKDLTDYQKADKDKIRKLLAKVNELQKKQDQYIVKNEYHSIVKSIGAHETNASTAFDRTDYFSSIPSNKLEVWLYLDSERLKAPVFRRYYSERDVVNEERRMRANEPDGATLDAILTACFTTLPYGHPIVGFASDLETVRREETMKFFKTYYAPNNTILTLVGDIKADEAYNLVNKYYGNIPRQIAPKPVFETEPPQKGERRVEVEFDASPQLRIAFHGPKPGSPDQYAMNIISDALSKGLSARFHENLIKKQIANRCISYSWDLAYTDIFMIIAYPRKGVTTAKLEEAIYCELDKFKTEPISKWELEKIHNETDKAFISYLIKPLDLARGITWSQAFMGGWQNFDDRAKLKAVTPEDVMKAANKYLVKSNRTVVTLVPVKKH
jgi:predicted Zn-dependent peptidase